MASIRNLVFAGAGLDGTPFAGALKEFCKIPNTSLKQIKRVAGTSAGAITALMVALNYSINEIEKFYIELESKKLDHGEPKYSRDVKKPRSDYDGDKLEAIIRELIIRKCGSAELTFKDLKDLSDKGKGFKELTILSMIVFMQKEEPRINRHIFSVGTTSATKVVDAVLPAASIPGMFPICYLKKTGDQLWEQGGNEQSFHHVNESHSPLPIETIFDFTKYAETKTEVPSEKPADEKLSDTEFFNKETLCFITRLEKQSEAKITHIPPDEQGKILYALTSATIGDEHNVAWIPSLNRDRTVFIDNSAVSSIKFGKREEKKRLLSAGEKAMHDYYEKHMSPKIEASRSKSTFFDRRRNSSNASRESSPQSKSKCSIM